MPARRLGIVALLLLACFPLTSEPAHAAAPPESGDFNGDGYADLAIGSPYDDVGTDDRAGVVNVIYGGATGLTSSGAQLWHLDVAGVPGTVGSYDYCGVSVAVGNFNGDGYGDLAFGCLYQNVSGVQGGGAVTVLFGSASGLTSAGAQRITQETPGVPDVSEKWDGFGYFLATGDANGDGFSDLAVDTTYEGVGGVLVAGAVTVLMGSAAGLTGTGSQRFVLGEGGVWGKPNAWDRLGWALSWGDVNADSYADLVVGSPGDDVSGTANAGSVLLFTGSPTTVSFAGHFVTPIAKSRWVGWDVAADDLSGDGAADVVITEPGARISGMKAAGQVRVYYGTSPLTAPAELWNTATPGVPGDPSFGEWFGGVLATGDMNGDGISDLAIEDSGAVGGAEGAGNAFLLYGGSGALTTTGAQVWNQDSAGILDKAETGDYFGWEMVAADFGYGPEADLVSTAPYEGLSGVKDAGALNVIYGSAGTGLTSTGNQFWHQDSPGIPEKIEVDDFFAVVVA